MDRALDSANHLSTPTTTGFPATPPPHPIFRRFRPVAEETHGPFLTDSLGVRGRRSFHAPYDESNGVNYRFPHLQPIGSEYFEWLSVLCAAAAAASPFTMIDLGSGWGRWVLRGALACRQLGKACQLVASEPEARHFAWMQIAFRDNDLSPEEACLVNAAVGAEAGTVWFHGGDSRSWYGQAILCDAAALECARRNASASQEVHREDAFRDRTTQLYQVRVVPLAELLRQYPCVHLLDMDIQNAEADVVEAARQEIDARVELVHISTHSADVERRLRKVFTELGWLQLFDFGCQGSCYTPYGELSFVDGVQTWIHPAAGHLLEYFADLPLMRFLLHRVSSIQGRLEICDAERDLVLRQLVACQEREEALQRREARVQDLEEIGPLSLKVGRGLSWMRRRFPRLAKGVKRILRVLSRRPTTQASPPANV